jgi:retron-type reverse transcriptase
MVVLAAIRGGNFNNAALAGVFYLNLNNAPSNANYNIGFRACKAQSQPPDARKGFPCAVRVALEPWPSPQGEIQKRGTRAGGNDLRGRVHNKMARTYNYLFERICDYENIYRAYLLARRNKRYHGDVLAFTADLGGNLACLQKRLMTKTYKTGAYKHFTVQEPKMRQVAALPFADRVVHHALCNIIEPVFERVFIHDSYACRIGKGVLSGVKRTTQFLRAVTRECPPAYCLKCDISKYFPSIDHETLKQIIRKKISCRDTLWLISEIIDSTGAQKGIPIGNLTSQLFANIYLNELDHYMKDGLGVRYYVRYMDDFIILDPRKSYLHDLLDKIAMFLREKLKLSLNRKTQIFPVKQRAIDFLGYRIWPDHRLLRKRNVKRMKRKIKAMMKGYAEGRIHIEDLRAIVMSWLGHAKHADTWRLRKRVITQDIAELLDISV